MRFSPGSPSFVPIVLIKDVSTILQEFTGLGKLSAGVGVYGEASAYALVWELGSRRLKHPGPKTIWSVNREGQKALLTKQAPFGYVTPVDEFWPIIDDALNQVNFAKASTSKELVLMLEIALSNASQKISHIIAQRAPIDSGDLRASIGGVDADELEDMGLDSGTLVL